MIPRHLLIGVTVMLALVLSIGLYLRHLSRTEAQRQRLSEDARPVTPPASGPTETVTLYVADDASGGLHPQPFQIPLPEGRQQRAEELLRALLQIYSRPDSPHPLSSAAELRSVFLIDPGVAVIDLNAAFADQHQSGVLTEQLTVNSLVQTLAFNVPGISRIRILVDGNTRETLAGHVDLTEFFDVNAVSQTASQNAQ